MTSTKASRRSFPPEKLKDLPKLSASNFLKMATGARKGITLVLGAGVSASAGIPLWNELLRRMCSAFFEHWLFCIAHEQASDQKPPTDLSIAFAQHGLHSNIAEKLGSTLAESDLLHAAQQIRNCIKEADWVYLLRHTLYDPIEYKPRTSPLIDALVQFCVHRRELLRGVISYNYDNLFESALAAQGVETRAVYYDKKGKVSPNALPIVYPHGITPIEGGYTSRITLSEMDYHHESAEPYSWANLIQLRYLTTSNCVFVGTSMTDPNHRRLLRIAADSQSPPHYCLLSTSNEDETLYDSLFDYDASQIGVLPIRYPRAPSADPFACLPQLIGLLDLYLTDKDCLW